MPLSKEYIDSVLESVEDFQIRRVDNISFKLYYEGEMLSDWKIKREAGLKQNISLTVQNRIKYNIKKYKKF